MATRFRTTSQILQRNQLIGRSTNRRFRAYQRIGKRRTGKALHAKRRVTTLYAFTATLKAYPQLFQQYLQCLTQLAVSQTHVEPALRTFEFQLLRTLGYGIDFTHCAGSGKPVEADMTYRYREEKGFIASLIKDNLTFYGHELLAFEQTQFDDPAVLSAAKRFTRIALKPYLGDKPLKSRELFTQHSLYSK